MLLVAAERLQSNLAQARTAEAAAAGAVQIVRAAAGCSQQVLRVVGEIMAHRLPAGLLVEVAAAQEVLAGSALLAVVLGLIFLSGSTV